MLLLALQVLGVIGLAKAFLLGLLLAVGSVFVSYPVGDNLRVMGFPFLAAAFERRGDIWIDFMSPLTPVAYLANATFAFVLPHLLLRAWRRWRP